MFSPVATWAIEGVVFTCLLASAATDLMDRIIPNILVLVIMVEGITLRLVASTGALWPSLLIWVVAIVALGYLAERSLLGWGDVKLIAAVTLLVPAGEVPLLLASIAISGGLLSCVYLAARCVVRPAIMSAETASASPCSTLQRLFDVERDRILARGPMPYALAILGGVTYVTVFRTVSCWPGLSC